MNIIASFERYAYTRVLLPSLQELAGEKVLTLPNKHLIFVTTKSKIGDLYQSIK